MSPRLVVILVLAGIVAFGAGIVTWNVVQSHATPISGSGKAAINSSADEEQRRHREQFFGGNSDRNIRGSQEMKPRW